MRVRPFSRPVPSTDLAQDERPVDQRVLQVHRIGALAVALVIGVFGILGFADGLAFFSTEGERILGLSSNGLLSTISIVTAIVLATAAFRGPRIASTVMITIGILSLVPARATLAFPRPGSTTLASERPKAAFSAGAGWLLHRLGP